MKKEVQTSKEVQDLYLTILNQLKAGNNPSKISKDLGIKKQRLQYYITTLKNNGLIQKKGYGTWEVKEVQDFNSNTLGHTSKSVRGHAFIWTIKLPKEMGGWEERLKALKIPYKLVRGQTPRIYLGKKKVWLGKKTITLYEPNSFYGQNAIESRKYAVHVLINDLRALESRLNFKLGNYVFTPSREHFALIKNDLAKQCNKQGDKIIVKDYNGDWLWIDNSDGISELETGNHNALVNNVGVQKWWNDMKQTKFEVTPSFILNSMNQVTNNQLMFNQNFESHVGAIRELSDSVRKLTEQVIKLEEENKKLRDGNI